MTQEIYGYYPLIVRASQNGDVVNSTVKYSDFDVNIQFVSANYNYPAYVSTEKGTFGGEVTLNRAATKEEHDDFIAILRGGEQKHSYRDLIVPVFLNTASNALLTPVRR